MARLLASSYSPANVKDISPICMHAIQFKNSFAFYFELSFDSVNEAEEFINCYNSLCSFLSLY